MTDLLENGNPKCRWEGSCKFRLTQDLCFPKNLLENLDESF